MSTSKMTAAPLASARRTRSLVPQSGLVEHEHGFAAHVLAGEIRLAPEPGVHGFNVDATGGQRICAVERLRAFEPHGLSSAGHDHLPGLRHPLRFEIQRLDSDVGQTGRLELRRQPLRAFAIGRRAGDAAPELRMDVVAIAPGNERLLDDIPVHALAVDRAVALSARRQRPSQECILELRIEFRARRDGCRVAVRRTPVEHCRADRKRWTRPARNRARSSAPTVVA